MRKFSLFGHQIPFYLIICLCVGLAGAVWWFLVYSIILYERRRVKPPFEGRILLVVAHPDDETMFFSPTLSMLKLNPNYDSEVHVLCLSTGNGPRKGLKRRKEMERALTQVFKVSKKQFLILYHDALPDGLDEEWDSSIVAHEVKKCVQKWKINTILTFDEHGVSSHPNHIGTYHGVKEALKGLTNVVAYKLHTSFLLVKYLGSFAFVWAFLCSNYLGFTKTIITYSPTKIFAGMQRHASQFVWYRKLQLVTFSYTWLNQWNEIKPEKPTAQFLEESLEFLEKTARCGKYI